jgi:hypothetical protein
MKLSPRGSGKNNLTKPRGFATLLLQTLNNTRPASAGLGRISAPGGLLFVGVCREIR